jgi:Ca2+-binding RTX toxin-like protein
MRLPDKEMTMAAVTGTSGADTLYGTSASDAITAQAGNDALKGFGGADRLSGGRGIDTAFYGDSKIAVSVNLASGLGFGGSAEGDTLVSIENLFGSEHNDALTGSLFANELHGQNGNDQLEGGAGGDVLDGGPGSDTASYLGSSSGVTVILINGNKWGGDAEGDTLISIENLLGSAHNDALRGDNNANVLSGHLGNDSLQGFGGNDVLLGGDGVDSLQGLDGDDTLYGGDGQDTILGGMNRDVLHGGNSADTFIWGSTDETGSTAATADMVLDFAFAESDRISVSLVDADVLAAGNQAFTFIGEAAFSGTPGEINYVHANGDTFIQLQTGTSPDIEGVIRLAGTVTPEASWFVL